MREDVYEALKKVVEDYKQDLQERKEFITNSEEDFEISMNEKNVELVEMWMDEVAKEYDDTLEQIIDGTIEKGLINEEEK